jgi:hypothetical protein
MHSLKRCANAVLTVRAWDTSLDLAPELPLFIAA